MMPTVQLLWVLSRPSVRATVPPRDGPRTWHNVPALADYVPSFLYTLSLLFLTKPGK
jgi:hypothetical protein